MSILDALPHLATARIRIRTLDTLGGSIDTFSAVFTDRPCWQQLASDREIAEYDKRGISVTDKVYFTSDPGIDERHILIIDGTTFEVRSRAKPDASAGMSVVWRVMCEERTTGAIG